MIKDKRKLWVIIIAALMISSVFGIMLSGFSLPAERVKYNGYQFKRVNDLWVTKAGDRILALQYLPDEVSDLNADNNALSRLSSVPMFYLTYDLNDRNNESMALVQYQLGKMLEETLKIFVAAGVTNNSNYKVPVITCSNSTEFVPVIELSTANTTQITLSGNNCIKASGKSPNDFYKIRDRILYSMFGIIK